MEEELDSMHLVDLEETPGYFPSLKFEHSSGEGDEGSVCRRDSLGARNVAPNLRRKAHRKSRGGCFNCKSRKIKVRSLSFKCCCVIYANCFDPLLGFCSYRFFVKGIVA